MRGAPLLVFAGTVAGLVGVLTFRTRPAPQAAVTPAAPPSRTTPAPSATAGRTAGPAAAQPAGRTAAGPSEQFSYGALDVSVTVRGTRITNVSVPALQTIDPTSQQISDEAVALLRTEVLSAQSARIDGVSGATFTSEAYAQSLQAALDKLHFR